MMEEYKIVDPLTITVKDGLPRMRKDLGKINELVDSFKKFGQLQPVLVNRQMELIAGGRRLAACIDSGIKVKIVFSDTVDPLIMREMELEENIQRKALTAAEEILAVKEIHEIKTKRYGEATSGREGGWRELDTATILGRTTASISMDLSLARALEDFPVLSECKTKSDIKRAVKGLQRIADSVAAMSVYEDKSRDKLYELYNEDAVEFMKKIPDKSINILLTDPPYGIDIHEITIGLGGHTGSNITTTGIKYEDSFEAAMELIAVTAQESSRFIRDDGFAVVFCAISNFAVIRTLFESCGWNCSQRPIIWIKNESGQNNAPSKWMSAGYESMLFARKLDARIVVEGKVDWIQCPNVTPSVRIHQAEKPVPLLKELLSRLAMPGAYVFDPFAGSCSTLEASIEMKMFPIGCEKSLESYAVGHQRIISYITKKG